MRTYIVINIVIATFVGDLCQPGLLGAKGLVQIKQFKLKKINRGFIGLIVKPRYFKQAICSMKRFPS